MKKMPLNLILGQHVITRH